MKLSAGGTITSGVVCALGRVRHARVGGAPQPVRTKMLRLIKLRRHIELSGRSVARSTSQFGRRCVRGERVCEIEDEH